MSSVSRYSADLMDLTPDGILVLLVVFKVWSLMMIMIWWFDYLMIQWWATWANLLNSYLKPLKHLKYLKDHLFSTMLLPLLLWLLYTIPLVSRIMFWEIANWCYTCYGTEAHICVNNKIIYYNISDAVQVSQDPYPII